MSALTQTTIDESTSNSLINYDEEFAKIAERTRNALVQGKGNYISTKGKLFTFPDGQNKPNFDCVVVNYIRINSLMPPYNPNVRTGPKCWALGHEDHLLVPSNKSPQRMADTCAVCVQNKFGSATNGGKGKACANTYRLAIVPTDATKESDIWLIKVSPTSLSRWANYVKLAEATYGVAGFLKVITNLSFDPNKDYPSLIFKGAALSPLDPSVVLHLNQRSADEIIIEPSGE